MHFFAILLLIFCLSAAHAQRKMPDISFKHNSTDFADANKRYDDNGQFADTLRDEHIIGSLARILKDNPLLSVELGGHSALNEDTLLAIQRAELVKKHLMEKGVSGDRLSVKSYAHRQPVISDKTVLEMASPTEREAANQRNRRVASTVTSIGEEQP